MNGRTKLLAERPFGLGQRTGLESQPSAEHGLKMAGGIVDGAILYLKLGFEYLSEPPGVVRKDGNSALIQNCADDAGKIVGGKNDLTTLKSGG